MFISGLINNRNKIFPGRKPIIVALLLLIVGAFSCEKQTPIDETPVVLSMFNGLDNGVLLYSNYGETHPILYIKAQQIYNRSALAATFDTPTVRARYFASPDTLKTSLPVFDKNLRLEKGLAYSLYLMGDRSAVDELLMENRFKGYNPVDSLTYIQIVNISNDQPISVNIKDDPNGNLIDNLPYKGASDFLELKAGRAQPAYEFEFRDAVTEELLATHIIDVNQENVYTNRFLYKNWTLVFVGKRGIITSDSIAVKRIEHFR